MICFSWFQLTLYHFCKDFTVQQLCQKLFIFSYLHLDHEEDIICFFCSTPVNRHETGNNRIFV